MDGIIIHTQECASNFGGTCYRNTVVCSDGVTRTLWVDPKMDNYRHWAEIMQVACHTKYRDKGIVLSGLQPLKKKNTNLNADYPPEFIDLCDKDELV